MQYGKTVKQECRDYTLIIQNTESAAVVYRYGNDRTSDSRLTAATVGSSRLSLSSLALTMAVLLRLFFPTEWSKGSSSSCDF